MFFFYKILRLELDFGYFRIFGLKSNQQNRPLILTSSSKSFNSLIHLEFELAPIHKKADFRFLLIMEPLTIIYHAATINEIVSHFEPIDKKTCSSTSIIKQRTFQQMENDLSNKKIFDMTMQIKGLSLLLPEYGYFKHWRIAVKIAKMAQVDLSRINLTKIINLNQSVPLFYSNMMETINRINLFFNIFPPHTSIESHASINKSYFVIMDPKTSIETDFSCHILKTRDEDEYSKSIKVILQNLSMILHSSLISIQSSWPFYQNNDIQLLYSDTDTKL
ncbi:unnamed protein product [Rotaria sp. Silwood2]|nr:unnamed protein product [Rotaria sp. Silwood2]CAF3178834.1 unnamed protein product [Rotaria sp. Silwood2]